MLPTYFISHGGGPWPWMANMVDGPYQQLAKSLRQMATDMDGKVRAIVMISAHWEEPEFTVQANPSPAMIYDYYGFPEHTYSVQYPAPGDPELAQQVYDLIRAAGLPAKIDAKRGYDHGLYSPMAIAYPQADMPIIQLSLKTGLDPLEHIKLGQCLSTLRSQNILLIGSGLSYHNLRRFGAAAADISKPFDAWLNDIVKLSGQARVEQLLNWEAAPNARLAHPREEHLLPLMFAIGAALDDQAFVAYHEDDFMGGVAASSFRFGEIS